MAPQILAATRWHTANICWPPGQSAGTQHYTRPHDPARRGPDSGPRTRRAIAAVHARSRHGADVLRGLLSRAARAIRRRRAPRSESDARTGQSLPGSLARSRRRFFGVRQPARVAHFAAQLRRRCQAAGPRGSLANAACSSSDVLAPQPVSVESSPPQPARRSA